MPAFSSALSVRAFRHDIRLYVLFLIKLDFFKVLRRKVALGSSKMQGKNRKKTEPTIIGMSQLNFLLFCAPNFPGEPRYQLHFLFESGKG